MDQQQPKQEYTESHFQVYEKLRKTLLKLHMMGLPGAEKMILALDKVQTENMSTARDEGQNMAGENDQTSGE